MFGHPKYFFALPDRDELITFPVLKSPFKATVATIFYFPWLEGVWLLLVQSHFYVLPEMKWLKRTPLGAARGLRKSIFYHSFVGKTKKKSHRPLRSQHEASLAPTLLTASPAVASTGAWGTCRSRDLLISPRNGIKTSHFLHHVCFECLWGVIFSHLWDSAMLNLQLQDGNL